MIVRTNKDFNLGCSATQMVISSTESEGSADVRNECERMVLIEFRHTNRREIIRILDNKATAWQLQRHLKWLSAIDNIFPLRWLFAIEFR